MTDSELISGGFFVVRMLKRPDGLAKQASLPEWLLTLSSCLTEFLPDAWALEWGSYTEAERVEAIEKLGIPAERLSALMSYTTAAFDRGELGWTCVWQSLDAARAIKTRFAETDSSLVILELAVPKDFAEKLLVHLAPDPREGPSGFYARLDARASLQQGGVHVGWEPLGVENGGSYHSWLCNHIQDAALARLGIAPGELGLLTSEKDARAVIGLIESGLGAEPVPWFPGLLTRFDG